VAPTEWALHGQQQIQHVVECLLHPTTFVVFLQDCIGSLRKLRLLLEELLAQAEVATH